MNFSKLRDWLEIAGLFAVVLSLMFVGVEVKQSHEIAVAAQYQARTELLLNMTMHRSEMPEYRRLIGKELRNPLLEAAQSLPSSKGLFEEIASMSDDRLGMDYQDIYLTFKFPENNHFQHKHGYFDDESWQTAVNSIDSMVKSNIVNANWPLMRHEFRASFRELVESRQAAIRTANAR